MNENISFRNLKTTIKTKGMAIKEVADACSIAPTTISAICNNRNIPLTSLVAKLCSVLKVYPSEIVSFDDIEVDEEVFPRNKREPLPLEFSGDVTYKPFWFFLGTYIRDWNKTHEEKIDHNDIFNQIEPPRRKNVTEAQRQKILESAKKGVEARYGKDHVAKDIPHTDYSKGLPLPTRSKLRNDKPLNIAVIYEICKYFHCSIDYVMGYK